MEWGSGRAGGSQWEPPGAAVQIKPEGVFIDQPRRPIKMGAPVERGTRAGGTLG